jgi:hypothetical protein
VGHGFVGMKDDERVDGGEIDGLAYSEDACEDVEDKDGTSSGLCRGEEEKNTDYGEKDGSERCDYEDDGEDMMERDRTRTGVELRGHGIAGRAFVVRGSYRRTLRVQYT